MQQCTYMLLSHGPDHFRFTTPDLYLIDFNIRQFAPKYPLPSHFSKESYLTSLLEIITDYSPREEERSGSCPWVFNSIVTFILVVMYDRGLTMSENERWLWFLLFLILQSAWFVIQVGNSKRSELAGYYSKQKLMKKSRNSKETESLGHITPSPRFLFGGKRGTSFRNLSFTSKFWNYSIGIRNHGTLFLPYWHKKIIIGPSHSAKGGGGDPYKNASSINWHRGSEKIVSWVARKSILRSHSLRKLHWWRTQGPYDGYVHGSLQFSIKSLGTTRPEDSDSSGSVTKE